MLSIHRNEVPDYLRKGGFFSALDPEDDGAFEVPSDCFKTEMVVESQPDVAHLLRSLSFWGVEVVPLVVLQFMIDEHKGWKWALFFFDFPEWRSVLMAYLLVANQKAEGRIMMSIDCELGIEVVQWLHESGCALNSDDCSIAAATDDLATLKFTHSQGFAWDLITLAAAIKNKSMQCVAYALQCIPFADVTLATCVELSIRSGSPRTSKFLLENGCEATASNMHYAVRRSNVACVRELHEHGCEWDAEFAHKAIQCDALECLQYACEQGLPLVAWDDRLCLAVILYDRVRFLKFLHEQGCNLDAIENIPFATLLGSVECLQFMHEQGCEWNDITYIATWRSKSWRCWWYAVSHGCPCYTIPSTYFFIGIYGAMFYCAGTEGHDPLLWWILIAMVSAMIGLVTMNQENVLQGVISIAARDRLRLLFIWAPVVITLWLLMQIALVQLGVTVEMECRAFE